MASTPALIGDVKKGEMNTLPVNVQNMHPHMMKMPMAKLTHTAAGEVRFQYKP